MGLYAGSMEWRSPFADGLVGIFSKEEVDLFKCTAIGLDTVEASHVYDGRSHLFQLIDSRHISA